MSLLSLILPTAGQAFSTEGTKVANDMTAVQTWANGNVDATNLANAVMAAYTPVWSTSGTSPAIGNGTLAGHYFAIGKCVLVRVYLAIGSTTTLGTGNWALTLPVAAKGDASTQGLTGIMDPAGTVTTCLGLLFSGSTAIAPYFLSGGTQISSPGSWASGNVLTLHGMYESA